jgi:hypothetical protein
LAGVVLGASAPALAHQHPALTFARMAGMTGPAVNAFGLADDPDYTSLPRPLNCMVEAVRAIGRPMLLPSEEEAAASVAVHAVAMPLWGNPFLHTDSAAARRRIPAGLPAWAVALCTGLTSSSKLRHVPGLVTVGDLRAILGRLEAWPGMTDAQQAGTMPHLGYLQRVLEMDNAASVPLAVRSLVMDPSVLRGVLQALWSTIPATWQLKTWNAVMQQQPLQSTALQRHAAVAALLSTMGWKRLDCAGHPTSTSPPVVLSVPLQTCVRDITPLLCGTAMSVRHRRQQQFIRQAIMGVGLQYETPVTHPPVVLPATLDDPAPVTEPAVLLDVDSSANRFPSTLKALWRLRWDNKHKEVLWRMSVNGIRGAGGHDVCTGSCACGWLLPPNSRSSSLQRELTGAPMHRQHTFWQCPVACAVSYAIRAALPPDTRLLCAHLWLCEPPSTTLNRHVWRVVCLAALSAMEYGRRVLWATHLGSTAAASAGQASGTGSSHAVVLSLQQRTLFEVWEVAPPAISQSDAVQLEHASPGAAPSATLSPVRRAARAAVSDFWGRLQDFARLHHQCDAQAWPGAAENAHPPLVAGHPFFEIRSVPSQQGQHERSLCLVIPDNAEGLADAAAAGAESFASAFLLPDPG